MAALFGWLYSKLAALAISIVEILGVQQAKALASKAGLFVALIAAFNVFYQTSAALIVQVLNVPTTPVWQTAAWVVLPDNAPLCLGSLATAKLAQWTYKWFAWKTKEITGGVTGL